MSNFLFTGHVNGRHAKVFKNDAGTFTVTRWGHNADWTSVDVADLSKAEAVALEWLHPEETSEERTALCVKKFDGLPLQTIRDMPGNVIDMMTVMTTLYQRIERLECELEGRK